MSGKCTGNRRTFPRNMGGSIGFWYCFPLKPIHYRKVFPVGYSQYLISYIDISNSLFYDLVLKENREIFRWHEVFYGFSCELSLKSIRMWYPIRSYEIHHVKPRLASPFPVTVVLWGGYAWRSIDDGPPGCEGSDFHGYMMIGCHSAVPNLYEFMSCFNYWRCHCCLFVAWTPNSFIH